MSSNYEQLRAQLIKLRKRHLEDKQAAVARRMGVSQAEISRIERGDPHISELERYVEALGGRLVMFAVAEAVVPTKGGWPVDYLPQQDGIYSGLRRRLPSLLSRERS